MTLGGSDWLHYLTGLVPGVVILLTLSPASRRWHVSQTTTMTYVAVASVANWAPCDRSRRGQRPGQPV